MVETFIKMYKEAAPSLLAGLLAGMPDYSILRSGTCIFGYEGVKRRKLNEK